MGFGRYRLPPSYIAERAAAGLGLPDGALQLGRHTLCDRVPEDLLGFLERDLQSRTGANPTTTASSLNSSTSTNASTSPSHSTTSADSTSATTTTTTADDITALPWLDPADVASHDNDEDGVWIVLDDLVLDVTVFQDIHPGGSSMFCRFAGGQCGKQFRRFHSASEVLDKWRVLVIGRTTMPSADDEEEQEGECEGLGVGSPPSAFNPMMMLCL